MDIVVIAQNAGTAQDAGMTNMLARRSNKGTGDTGGEQGPGTRLPGFKFYLIFCALLSSELLQGLNRLIWESAR